MQQAEQALRLLIVESQLEQAEFLISHIRNGGTIVRPERAEDIEDVDQFIENNQVDMVITKLSDTEITIADIKASIKKSGKDIPIIAVVEQISNEVVLDSVSKGVHDIILREQAKQIQHVIKQQFQALLNRRALRLSEATIRESERRCDALIESSRDPIAYIHDGMHIRANESYLSMFGYENFDEIEGMPILDLIDSENQGLFKQIIKDFAKTKQCPRSISVTIHPENGNSTVVEFELSPASYDGELCMQLVARPQMMDEKLTEQLRDLKDRDQNTKLFNRKYFMSELEAAASAAISGKNNQSVLFVNPDQFEQRVRSLGLNLTDHLLIEFANRLQAAVGENGVCCHYRDHSLAVLCTNSNYQQTQALTETIHKAFDNVLLEIENQSISFSVSIATIQITEENASIPEILSTGSRILLSIEGLGGNRFELYDPSAGERADAELDNAWKERLLKALKDDEFTLRFQPIINLTQQEDAESYDLLIRLQAPDGETVSPDQFLPIAESHNLMVDIDLWVVKHAIAILAERKLKEINTQLFVKISPDTMQDSSLVKLIQSEFGSNKLEGQSLIFQIPESKIITRLKGIQQFKLAMQPLGVRLSLTQFGTSVDSLNMLSHFDADFINIDRSFIEDLDKNTEHQAKVREFIRHAQSMNKQTMAEFVSDAGTVGFLYSAGIDWIQGNFLSPPLQQMNYDFSA
ncbi:MAG: EAL domain-containing protein [Arenimonas sp.]|nr:EAL domain-containing protein [Arenimonas sp.]